MRGESVEESKLKMWRVSELASMPKSLSPSVGSANIPIRIRDYFFYALLLLDILMLLGKFIFEMTAE